MHRDLNNKNTKMTEYRPEVRKVKKNGSGYSSINSDDDTDDLDDDLDIDDLDDIDDSDEYENDDEYEDYYDDSEISEEDDYSEDSDELYDEYDNGNSKPIHKKSSASSHRRSNLPGKRESKNKQPKKKKPVFLFVITVIFAFTTIFSVLLNFYIIQKKEDEKAAEIAAKEAEFQAYLDNQPVTYTQEQVDELVQKAYDDGSLNKETEIKSFIMDKASQTGPSLGEILRLMFEEYVVFSGDGQFYFELINNAFAKNTVNQENLVVSENKIELIENGETVSRMGIDVSEYQGNIDWEKVADSGVEFAIIRAGYRGYGTGKLVQDAKLIRNIEGALDNDIEVGVYFFTQAINEEEMQEEVDTVMSYIEPYHITGPIVIDVEKIDSDKARGNALTKEERTRLVKYFCDAVRKEGYTPMIYGNTYSLFGMLDINEIHDEKIWYAYYTYSFLYYPYKMDIWQYSDKMTIPGINGNVDVNIMFP